MMFMVMVVVMTMVAMMMVTVMAMTRGRTMFLLGCHLFFLCYDVFVLFHSDIRPPYFPNRRLIRALIRVVHFLECSTA